MSNPIIEAPRSPHKTQYGRQSIPLSFCDRVFSSSRVFTFNRFMMILRFLVAAAVFALSVINMTSEKMLANSLRDISDNWLQRPFTEIVRTVYQEDQDETTILCPENFEPYGALGRQQYLSGRASEEITYESKQYAWKKQTFCVFRPAEITSSITRHRLNKEGETCPNGMLQCGSDCYNGSIGNCPISFLSIKKLETDHIEDGTHFNYLGKSYELLTHRQGQTASENSSRPLLDLTIGIQPSPVAMCLGMRPGSFYVREQCPLDLQDQRYLSLDSYIDIDATLKQTNFEMRFFEENYSPADVLDMAEDSEKEVMLFSRQEIPWKFHEIAPLNLMHSSEPVHTSSLCTVPAIEVITPLLQLDDIMDDSNKFLFTVGFFAILFSFFWLFLSAGEESKENSVEWGCTALNYHWGMGVIFFFLYDVVSLYIIYSFAKPGWPLLSSIETAKVCLDDLSLPFISLYAEFINRAVIVWFLTGGFAFLALTTNVISIRAIRYLSCCLCETEEREPIFLFPKYGTDEYFHRYSSVIPSSNQLNLN